MSNKTVCVQRVSIPQAKARQMFIHVLQATTLINEFCVCVAFNGLIILFISFVC